MTNADKEILEDYVSFETAKLLKKKGFKVETEHELWYVVKEFSTGCHWNSCTYKVGDITREYDEKRCITMPTLQMAMKWLREVHHLHIIPEISDVSRLNPQYYVVIWLTTPKRESYMLELFDSYEEAVEEGIKYCLENLI
jgi:hypothetical protein